MKNGFFASALIMLALLTAGCAEPHDREGSNDVIDIPTETVKADLTAAPVQASEEPEATEIFLSPSYPPSTEAPKVPAITSVSGKYRTYDGTNIMRVDDRAYEMCVFLEDETKSYAALISDTAARLKGKTTVYDLIIPTAYGVMMPDDMRESISFYIDTGECIEKVYSDMSSDVKTVSCYDTLMRHRDEFIYFRTDHHWTANGAYYAYSEFCKKKGVEPYSLEGRRVDEYGGFLGSLYKEGGNIPELLPEETVYAYWPVSENVKMLITTAEGNQVEEPIIKDVSNYSGANKYSTFAGGDNPITEFTNEDVTDGSVCIIIKESFGNALLPFIADHYSKVYEIDYRYWKGNVVELAEQVGANDLIFANNFMMISSKSNIGKLNMILH